MKMNPQPQRNEPGPPRATHYVLDDTAVLRLSRPSLRAQPPVVQFVSRVSTSDGHQRLLWPA